MLQRQEMGINAAAADDVSARWWQRHLAESRQHRSGEQNRSPDLGAQRRIQRLRFKSTTVYPHQIWTSPVGARPEIHQQGKHRFDIPDAGDVVEIDRTVGQDRGRKDRERGVFVARGADRST
jgi:hypothetical protein